MSRVFISYSRKDESIVKSLLPLLNKVFPKYIFWYDENISGGEDWWQRILTEIGQADLFLFLISSKTVESAYCQAELREALRLQKPILPVIVRGRTNLDALPDDLTHEIRRREYIDLGRGLDDRVALTALYGSIGHLLGNPPAQPLVPLAPHPVAQPSVPVAERKKRDWSVVTALISGAAIITAAIIMVLPNLLSGNNSTEQTRQAQQATIPTTTIQSTATELPTDIPDVVYVTETYLAQASADAQQTQILVQTVTMSVTATPSFMATVTVARMPLHTATNTAKAQVRSTSTLIIAQITVIAAFDVNIRSGPGTTYTIVGKASPYTTYVALGRLVNSQWYLIDYNGQDAWIFGDPVLVRIDGNANSLPPARPPSTPTPLPAGGSE